MCGYTSEFNKICFTDSGDLSAIRMLTLVVRWYLVYRNGNWNYSGILP